MLFAASASSVGEARPRQFAAALAGRARGSWELPAGSAHAASRDCDRCPPRARAARRLAARRRGRAEQKSTAPTSWLRRRGARDAGGGARPREDGGVPEGPKRAEVRARRPARRARRPEPRTALGDPCTPFGAPFSRTPSALLTGDDPPSPPPRDLLPRSGTFEGQTLKIEIPSWASMPSASSTRARVPRARSLPSRAPRPPRPERQT